jgi:hypothetical protein
MARIPRITLQHTDVLKVYLDPSMEEVRCIPIVHIFGIEAEQCVMGYGEINTTGTWDVVRHYRIIQNWKV